MSASEILLTRGEVFPHAFMGENYFYPEAIDEILEAKRADKTTPSGVKEAVKLLLSQCATVINHVDVTKTVETPYPDEDSPVYKRGTQLGFNDHCGGSESDFKILVNHVKPGLEPQQQVLYAPPNEDGSPSNTVFHGSDFVFLGQPAEGLRYPNSVPNALKTGGAAGYRDGDRDFDFFVFGDSETPLKFSRLLEDIGFSFDDQPYSEVNESELWHLEGEAKSRFGFTEMHHWPGRQFAAQLAILETLEA